MCLQYKSLENTVGKGEIASNKQFLHFLLCFLHIWRTFCHFNKNQNCRLQTLSVWKRLKLVILEKVCLLEKIIFILHFHNLVINISKRLKNQLFVKIRIIYVFKMKFLIICRVGYNPVGTNESSRTSPGTKKTR